MDVLNENVSFSLFLKLSKSLLIRCGAEPSAKAHFQFTIEEKSCDKHKRLSAGKATVQHNRNSQGHEEPRGNQGMWNKPKLH